MKIAILADLHLPNRHDTVNEDILDWALDTLLTRQVQLIVLAGDMIQAGAVEAATRLRHKLAMTGLPFLMVLGNTELDTPGLKEIFTGEDFQKLAHGVVAALTPSEISSFKEHSVLLKKLIDEYPESFMLVNHYPLDALPDDVRAWTEELFRGHHGAIFIAGHQHMDNEQKFAEAEFHIVRGLDSDKAIGAPPALHIFEYEQTTRKWHRRDIAFAGCNPVLWHQNEIDKFTELLGVSTMHNTIKGIDYAISQRIKCLEIRFEATKELSLSQLSESINSWRKSGGKVLSLHFPDISWDKENNTLAENEIPLAIELAIALKINRLTIHVPRVSVAMFAIPHIGSQLRHAFVKLITHVLPLNISIGIENLHMRPGEKADESRGFGYTPDECIAWVNELRNLCHSSKIGLHFDIGHARNNAPYSRAFSIAQWYASAGSLINGYHLHQVVIGSDGVLENHQPIKNIFGPLISFSSFFYAWQNKKIVHAPIFIETDALELSYETLSNCFFEQEMNLHEK